MSGLGRGVRESTYIHSLVSCSLLLHCLSGEKDQKILGTGRSQRDAAVVPQKLLVQDEQKGWTRLKPHLCLSNSPSFCWLNPPPANSQRDFWQEGLSHHLPFPCPGASRREQRHKIISAALQTPLAPLPEIWRQSSGSSCVKCKMMWSWGTRCHCCGWELITSFLWEKKKKKKRKCLFNLTPPPDEGSSEVPLYLDNFSSHPYSFLFLSPPASIGHISVLKGVVPAWWEAGSIGRPKRVWKVLEVVFTK